VSTAKSKSRPYDSSRRREKAEASRLAVLEVAGRLFHEKGYQGATVANIASTAGVSAETVYGNFGTKADLLAEWFRVIVFGDEVLQVTDRPWVLEMRASDDFDSVVALFAAGVCRILENVYPAYSVARAAARSDERVAEVYKVISNGRLTNLRGLAEILAAKSPRGERNDLGEIAEFMWAIVSPAVYESLTVERGWTPAQYEAHLMVWIKAEFGS